MKSCDLKIFLKRILAVAILSFVCLVYAAEMISPISLATSWLANDNQIMTLTEVIHKTAQDFSPIQAQGTSLSFHNKPVWLRVELHNSRAETVTGWLDLGSPLLAQVVLYQQNSQKHWTFQQSGLTVPVSQRALPNRGMVFPLQLKALEKRIVYLSIQSGTVISLIPRWWTAANYQKQQQIELCRDLLMFGAILGLALFGLVHAMASRDILVALNALRALFITAHVGMVTGYLSFYIWPQSPAFLFPLTYLSLIVVLIIQLSLVIKFLPNSYYPTGIRYFFYSVLAIMLTALVTLTITGPIKIVLSFLSFFGLVVQSTLIYATFIAAWRGFRPAWWLLAGFSTSIFGSYRKLAEALAWIAPSDIASFMMLVNVFISTLFFYIATSVRVDLLRNEREHALKANLLLQRETEFRLATEVKLRTAELEIALDEADRANQAKTLFLAKVSHELRSPLHTILSYADLTRQQQSLTYLNTITDAGQHLLNLIDDLLAYVKNSYAELHIDKQPVYTHDLLEQFRAYGKSLAAQSQNEFVLSVDKNFPICIEIDSRRLIQIAVVLLSNAATYTQNGTIKLILKPQENHLELQVQDNGAGIANEDKIRIFQPFERVAHNSHVTGLGLGLAIALQLAKAMGGDLCVESELGKGSCFTLYLPLIVIDSAAIAPIKENPTAQTIIGYHGALRRILIIEDTLDHLNFMREFLEAIGFEIITAHHPQAALDYVHSQTNCDLVLLDFHLGNMTAAELLPQLRQSVGWETVPVILISASPPEQELVFAAILTKPVTQFKILDTFAQVLGIEWQYAIENNVVKKADCHFADWEVALNAGDVFALENCIHFLADSQPDLAQQARQYLARYDFEGIRELVVNYLMTASS